MRKNTSKTKIKPGHFGRWISTNKIKLVRGYSYISALAIPFLVAREIARIFPAIPWWIIFSLAVIGVWIIGHIDFKRLWKNELEFTLTKNPEWIRTMREMIKKELKGKNEKKIRKRIPRKKT